MNYLDEEKNENDTEQELIGTLMKDFSAMMNDVGPVVRALLLKADGSVLEVDYDSTPKNNHISKILGGAPTILGELPGNIDGVILTKKLTPDPMSDLPNQHTVVAPFGEVLGDVFVTRLDHDIQPQHFGLTEFESWKSSNELCPSAKAFGKLEEVSKVEDVDEEEEFDYEAEDNTDDEYDPADAIMHTVINTYMAKHGGKVPTAEEVKSIIDQMGFSTVSEFSSEEERKLLAEAYETEHGERPTSEQLDIMMKKIPRIKAALLSSDNFTEDTDEDADWVPPDANNESCISSATQNMVLS